MLLAIFFAAAASSGQSLREVLNAGLDRMQEIGGARPGDGTMIDALHPALEQLATGLDEAARAARDGADRTAAMETAKADARLTSTQISSTDRSEAVARLFESLAARADDGTGDAPALRSARAS